MIYFQNFACHVGASVFSAFLVSPLDRMRILRQANILYPPSTSGLSGFVRSQWKGGFANISLVSCTSLLRVYLALNLQGNQSEEGISMKSAFLSSFIASSVTYPLDVRFTRRIAGEESFQNIPKIDRFVSLYRGFVFHLLATPLAIGTSLATIYTINHFQQGKSLEFPGNLLLGGISAFVGSTVAYPLDTLKRRIIFGNFSRSRLYTGFHIHAIKLFPEFFFFGLAYSYLLSSRYI